MSETKSENKPIVHSQSMPRALANEVVKAHVSPRGLVGLPNAIAVQLGAESLPAWLADLRDVIAAGGPVVVSAEGRTQVGTVVRWELVIVS